MELRQAQENTMEAKPHLDCLGVILTHIEDVPTSQEQKGEFNLMNSRRVRPDKLHTSSGGDF